MTDPRIGMLEHMTHVAPLGLRFEDVATRQFIGGLRVVVAPLEPPRDHAHDAMRFRHNADGVSVPAGAPRREIPTFSNRSGIYVAARLPGLADAERGMGDTAFWSSPPALRAFTVSVADPERRYLPCRFDVLLPFQGLAVPNCLLPTTPSDPAPAGVPLFSAPTRPIPVGMAALRAEVWDDATDRPAAWALLEVVGAQMPPARGLTDERGCGVVIFPYPEPELFGTSSPPSGGAALLEQRWDLTLRIFATTHDGSGPTPDLCQVLQQGHAPPRAEVHVPLIYGQEAIIATWPHSTLLLPVGSPA
jgi:hypothetical protein